MIRKLKNSNKESHFINKMILTNMINVLIIAIICGLFYIGSIYSIKQETLKYTSQIVFQVSVSLDTIVENLQEMAWRVLSNDDAINILRDNIINEKNNIEKQQNMSKIIYNAAGYSNNIEAFTVFSSNGETYDAGNKSTKLNYNYKTESWYKEMKTQNSIVLNTHVQTHVTEGTAVKVISLVKRINDPLNGDLLGYILIDLNANVYNQLFNKVNMIPKCDIIVADNRGNVVYGSSTIKLNDKEMNDLLVKVDSGISGSIEENYGNKEMYVNYYNSMKTGWKTIYITPISEASKNLIYVKRLTLALTFISMLLAVIISVIMSKKVTQPLMILSKGIKELEKGNMDVIVDIKSNDEIGAVGKSFNKMVCELKYLIEKVYKAEIGKKEAVIQALQAQINPHFLYNTLAVVDGIATVNGQDDIKKIVQALSKIFRYSISGSEVTTIEEEMNYVKMYLDIQEIRLYNVLESKISYDENLKECAIPKLIVQPLVENAFVHGFNSEVKRATINIKVEKKDKDIVIIVEDNGCGIKNDKLNEILMDIEKYDNYKTVVKNIGLRNVNTRIKSIYGDQYGLFITSNIESGTTSTIKIPFSILEDHR